MKEKELITKCGNVNMRSSLGPDLRSSKHSEKIREEIKARVRQLI